MVPRCKDTPDVNVQNVNSARIMISTEAAGNSSPPRKQAAHPPSTEHPWYPG